MESFKPIKLGPGDIGVDPAYWEKDNSGLMAYLEQEQLDKFEKSLTDTSHYFLELISNADRYDEIVYWLGEAIFKLIEINPQTGRNRYAPVRRHMAEIEFEICQALEVALAVLWAAVTKEAQEEYHRQMERETPF